MIPASETDPSDVPPTPDGGRTERRRGLARAMLAAAIVALGVFLAFFALAYLSLGTDRAALTARINAAFVDGTLDPQASWRHGDTNIGAHQYNDCLILFQAMDDRAPAALRAVSPLSVPVDTDQACETLAGFAAGRIAPPTRHYHQYLHAHTTLARLLLPSLGVSGLRGLYKLALTLTLLAGIGYALMGLARERRMAEQAAWLTLFLAFSRWFGLESFGQSLGHGPADLVPLAFLLFLMRASASAPLTQRAAIVGSAIFGALTMQFEFLTGGLPLGLAIVIGALPLALPREEGSATVLLRSVAAYLSAVVTTAAAKLVLITLVFGPATLFGTGRQLLFRTGLSRTATRDVPVGWSEFADHVWAGMGSLAPGMHSLAVGMVLLAGAAGGWGYRQLRSVADPAVRLRAVALLGSMLVPLLWMVVFWQHTAEHAWFMDRILVWIIAAGGALFVLAVAERPKEAGHRQG